MRRQKYNISAAFVKIKIKLPGEICQVIDMASFS
jgi:hypothetical protein